MSKIKKVLAMLLALAMVLGTTLTTFAAEVTETTSATVTVNGADNAEIKYLQIVEPNRESTDGYAIKSEYASYFGNIAVADLIHMAEGTPNGNVTAGKLHSNQDLAAILQSIATNKATDMTVANNASFDAKQGGLYLITASLTGYTYSPMLVYVPVNSTTPIPVTAKGAPDQIIKAVGDGGESVAEGDTVSYAIDSVYPYFGTQYTNVKYVITDKLTNATYDKGSLVVSGAGDKGYTVKFNDDNNEFTITFDYDYTLAGNPIEIKYDAIVGKVSTTNPLENIVRQETGTGVEGDPITKTEYHVISNPVKLVFDKVDAGDVTHKLDNAEFSLYKENGDLVFKNIKGVGGVFTIDGLDSQESYYVVETKAPDGYKLDETKYPLTRVNTNDKHDTIDSTRVDEDGVTVTVKTTTHAYDDDFHVNKDTEAVDTIPNTTLSSLPSTGGIGTTIFTIGGCLIMIVAAGLFFASRRKSAK